MAVTNNNLEFSSPAKESFSWVTPDNDLNKISFPSKRKCNSDSGYVSSDIITPASGCRTSSRNRMLMTPDISNSDGFGSRGKDTIYTPSIAIKTDCLKKRLLQCSQDGHSSSFFNTMSVDEVDSFSDFMEASLYTEPMEISMIESTQHCTPSPMDLITEENIDMCEISKKITVDLSVDEVHSICSEPITPFRSLMPADRLYKSSSLKSSLTSPRKKRYPLKKKTRTKSLVGSEKVDFLYQLGEKANFSLAVSKILDYVSDSDLGNVTMVSKTWNKICLSHPKAKERWKKYVADRKERKENLRCSGGKQKRGTTPLVNRNHSTPLKMRQPSSPPVSPSKYRFHLFQKEASKLKEDEKLMVCPRCSLPSTVSPVTRFGRCSRAGCGLEFCSSCKSPYHGTTPCTTSTPTSPQRPKRIGSKESKRYLRRL